MNSMFRLSVMVVGIAAILFYYNWQLALVALVPVPLIGLFTYYFIQIIQPKYAEVRSTVGKTNSRLENNLGGIKVIKSSNTESYESERVDDVSRDYFDANWDAIETACASSPAWASSRPSSSAGPGSSPRTAPPGSSANRSRPASLSRSSS
jgi:ATP-binding cassette subfamily B protein